MNVKITGSGTYIPSLIQDNSKFLDRVFFDIDGKKIETINEEIVEKFQKITGIKERRYAKDELNTSDGWMRATSPNGNPNFQNVVNWSGSLGVGKKPPEEGQTLEEE